jgi:hypothetical protein
MPGSRECLVGFGICLIEQCHECVAIAIAEQRFVVLLKDASRVPTSAEMAKSLTVWPVNDAACSIVSLRSAESRKFNLASFLVTAGMLETPCVAICCTILTYRLGTSSCHMESPGIRATKSPWIAPNPSLKLGRAPTAVVCHDRGRTAQPNYRRPRHLWGESRSSAA